MTELTESDVDQMEQAGLVKVTPEAKLVDAQKYVAMLLADNDIATIEELSLVIFFAEARHLAVSTKTATRARTITMRQGWQCVGELLECSWEDLLDLREFGVTCLDLVEEQLALMGLQLAVPSQRRGTRGT